MTLGSVAQVYNGKTPSKLEHRACGHPVLKIKDISEVGQFKGQYSGFVNESFAARYRQKWIAAGDTLILNAAHNSDYVASKAYLATDQVAGSLPTGEWAVVRPDAAKLLPEYFYFWLRTDHTRKLLKFLVKGIHLYPKDVATLQVPVPPIAEQGRIVELLSRAENIVRMRREAEKKAREIIPALFLDMFGDLGMNSNGGDAAGPREHGDGRREANSVVRLGDVAEIASGVAKGRKLVGKVIREVPYLRVANVQAGGLDLAEMKYIPATADEIAELAVRAGDVLLTEGGDFDKVGRGALLEANIGECIHQNHVFRVRTHAHRVVPEYFAAYLQTSAARQYFLKAAKKTSNLASINMTQLRNLPLSLPRLETQRDFQERFRACRALERRQSDATGIADVSFQSLLAGVFSERQSI
jgi:type I restriction enzyme S subunit